MGLINSNSRLEKKKTVINNIDFNKIKIKFFITGVFLSKILLLLENISNTKKYATKYQNSLFKLQLKTIRYHSNKTYKNKNQRQKKKYNTFKFLK